MWVGSSDGVLRAYDINGDKELLKNTDHSAGVLCIEGTVGSARSSVALVSDDGTTAAIIRERRPPRCGRRAHGAEQRGPMMPRRRRLPSTSSSRAGRTSPSSSATWPRDRCGREHRLGGSCIERRPALAQTIRKLLGHTNWVRDLKLLSPGGAAMELWSGSDDGIRVWELVPRASSRAFGTGGADGAPARAQENGKCIAQLASHGAEKKSNKVPAAAAARCPLPAAGCPPNPSACLCRTSTPAPC